MARTGLGQFIGFAQESTVGTRVAPTRFLPIVQGGLKEEIEPIRSAGIVPGNLYLTAAQVRNGNVSVTGDPGFELNATGTGLLFYNALGAKATTGAGPYVHTITAGNRDTLGLTVQHVLPDVGGTSRVFEAAGCKIQGLEVAAEIGQAVTMGLDLVGMTLTSNQSAATASYGTNALKPLTFVDGSVTVGGSAVPLRSVKTNFSSGLVTDRRFLGQATISEALEGNEVREFMIEAEAEFEGLTHFAAFVAGSTASVVQTFTDGTNSVVITATARYEDAMPVPDGRNVVKQPLKFYGVSGDVQVVVTDNSSTA